MTIHSAYWRGMRPLTALLMLIFIFGLISISQVAIFEVQISRSTKTTQADFLIDAYFYIDIGLQAARDYLSRPEASLLSSAEDFRPNLASTGITLINEIYGLVIDSAYGAAIFQSILLALVVFVVWSPQTFVGNGLSLAVMGGILPYVLLPSKESFMLIGYMLFIAHWFDSRCHWFGSIAGALLMALVRPESLVILILTLLVTHSWKRSIRWMILVGLIFVYLGARSSFIELAEFNQILAEAGMEGFFCFIGPINACVETPGLFELTMLYRLILTVGVPLKWVWDWLNSLSTANAAELVVKTSLLFLLVWVVLRRRELRWANLNQPMNRFSLIFSAIYLGAFATIVFYQPSRQVAMAICMVLVSLGISKDRAQPCRRG